MIGSLRGRLLEVGEELLIEVAGVGYRVQVGAATVGELRALTHVDAHLVDGGDGRGITDGTGGGGTVFLHVHHVVREDSQTLYGFTTSEERRVFSVLLATHGVGPALALAILSTHRPAALRVVVASGDIDALCLVPGVGRKTAARLLVELTPKLGEEVASDPAGVVAPAAGATRSDLRDALAGLGYGPEEIRTAIADLPEDGDVSELLRQALQRLAAA